MKSLSPRPHRLCFHRFARLISCALFLSVVHAQAKPGKGKGKGQFKEKKVPPGLARKAGALNESERRTIASAHHRNGAICNCDICDSVNTGTSGDRVVPGSTSDETVSKQRGKGNNGLGNGPDPQPPGNPRVNDGDGAAPGSPGNKKGGGVKGGGDHKAEKAGGKKGGGDKAKKEKGKGRGKR